MQEHMDELNQALDELADLLKQMDDPKVDPKTFSRRMQAWYDRWVAGDELPEIMRLSLVDTVAKLMRQGILSKVYNPLTRTPEEIAKEGGSIWPK